MSKQRLIIGFSGWRGNGKTTAAVYLARKYGFHTVSFASSLKEMARLFFPFDPSDWSERNKEKAYKDYDWSPRDFAVALGEFARFHDPDYWVKKANIEDQVGDISIDDVRFQNEVDYIKSLGGKTVRIERQEKLNVYGKHLNIPSETALDNYKGFDFRIESCWNVEMEDLHRQLDNMMKQFREDGKE
jgi:hypothetical protein